MADWIGLKAFLAKRRKQLQVEQRGTFVVPAEMHRSEDLRPDLIGVPSEDEVRDEAPHDPWRPSRTLGRLNYPR